VCTFKVKINFFHLLSAEKLIFRGAHTMKAALTGRFFMELEQFTIGLMYNCMIETSQSHLALILMPMI
jgi:hypothetical protein